MSNSHRLQIAFRVYRDENKVGNSSTFSLQANAIKERSGGTAFYYRLYPTNQIFARITNE